MLNKDGALPDSDLVAYLEDEPKATKKQVKSLTGRLFASITILCLPLPRGRRLKLGLKQVECLPNGILTVIARRCISESRTSDPNFDGMPGPLAVVLGFERAWNTVSIDHLRDTYGSYAALRREETAKSQPCEG